MGTKAGSVSHMVNVVLAPMKTRLSMEAIVVPKVTCELPLTGANHLKDLVLFKDLELADPLFYKPGKIDVLLGCNVYQDLLLSSTKKGSSDEPVAVETIFGWAVMGRYNPNHTSPSAPILNLAPSSSTDSMLQRFWEIEEVPG